MIKEVETPLPGWIACTGSAGKKRSAIIAEDVLWVQINGCVVVVIIIWLCHCIGIRKSPGNRDGRHQNSYSSLSRLGVSATSDRKSG